MGRVVVVDDERQVATVVASYLEREGFTVRQAYSGPEALEVIRDVEPDLVILDVMLPGIDGNEVCRQLRTFSDAYVLMLTARGEETDAVIGLSSGADDYVVKPFGPRELIARVKAMMRRPRIRGDVNEDHDLIERGRLRLCLTGRQAFLDGQPIELTRTEFDMLAVLAERQRAVLTRVQILDRVWGPNWVGDDHVVDVHVGHIRAKLAAIDPAADLVRTVRGVGYGLMDGS